MPHKPLTPCRYPGCPKLVPGRYCEEHQKLVDKQYEQYDRDPVEKKRYGRAWKRIRDRYISAAPSLRRVPEARRLHARDRSSPSAPALSRRHAHRLQP
jgi:5-methylcytosine-specific restriction protein A